VWELALADFSHEFVYDPAAFARSPTDRVEFEVSASRVQIAPAEPRVGSIETMHVTNEGAPLSGGVLTQALGRRAHFNGRVVRGERAIFPFDVADDVQLLVLDFAAVQPVTEDIDASLFRCAAGSCTVYRASRSRESSGRMVVRNAAAGAWKLVISGDFLQQETAAFEISLVMTSPLLGSLVTNDRVAFRRSGATWNVKGGVWRPMPSVQEEDLVALSFVSAPEFQSLHESEPSMRPFVALLWHPEPLLLGLRYTTIGAIQRPVP
jgi:hypothetical protein